MPDFETSYNNSLLYVCSYGANFSAADGDGFIDTLSTTLSWVANLALYLPFVLYAPFRVQRFSFAVVTATCNVDVGVYTIDGELLSSIGGVASTHNTRPQFANASTPGTLLNAGAYYLGVACSSSTISSIVGSAPTAGQMAVMGVKEQTTAYPLPAAATFSQTTRALYPLAGMAQV